MMAVASPSSSAVTIPRPGKSILKRPPPPQPSLLSRLTKFLPQQQQQQQPQPNSPYGSSPSPYSHHQNQGAVAAGSGGGGGTSNADPDRPLKRAHFILPQIATVYSISTSTPPCTPNVKEEMRATEDRERERRRRVVRSASSHSSSATSSPSSITHPSSLSSNSISTSTITTNTTLSNDTTNTSSRPGYGYGLEKVASPVGESEWWKMDKVESFYRECCEGCDERPDPQVSRALKHATSGNGPGRTVDLSGVQVTPSSAGILSDVFSIEWGLRKLVCRECDLDHTTLKPILHALLITDSLSFLSVASNRRMKPPAFRLLAAYLSKSNTLQFLDLSQNPLEKKSVEFIVSALVQLPSPTSPYPSHQSQSQSHSQNNNRRQGLVSLRLDDCQLRPASLEILARAIRTSSLRHLSLRHNKINATGAVALAVLIRDYPDVVPAGVSYGSAASSLNFTPPSSMPPSPTVSSQSLPLSTTTASPTNAAVNAKGPLPPPPRHPGSSGPQTTYTPYIPRAKRGQIQQQLHHPQQQPTGGVPILTSSSQGGITTLTHSQPIEKNLKDGAGQQRNLAGPSAALLDKVRALDALPRLGALRTLDLRGNDLRSGVSYIAQVLKRNRTLRVLNLAENKLDVSGLVVVAEALKYNSTLETLDMSRNPCCGPGLDGIQSLRTAITLNSSLKRLFLSSTHLTTAGAISLAEFLPESTSLLHLDLTGNSATAPRYNGLNGLKNGSHYGKDGLGEDGEGEEEDMGVGLAGVLALSEGLKSNHVMRCLDLDVRPGDEELARICQEILKTCIRNTEEAEKNNAVVGRGVWGMIEESELARRMRFGNDLDNQIIVHTKTLIAQLHIYLDGRPPSSLHLSPALAASLAPYTSNSPHSQLPLPSRDQLLDRSKRISKELVSTIQSVSSSQPASQTEHERALAAQRLEELLSLYDQLMALIARAEEPPLLSPTPISGGASPATIGTPVEDVVGREGGETTTKTQVEKNKANLKGLGLRLDTIGISDTDRVRWSQIAHDRHGAVDDEEQGEEVSTPRVDKGKARAAPEPEAVEKVLSPTRLLIDGGILEHVVDTDVEEEGEIEEEEEVVPVGSTATDRSKSWVEEEGEVFRKGTVLLGPEEMEGEYDSEVLRKELLDAMVERTPRRPPNPEGDYNDELQGPVHHHPSTPPESIPLPSSPSLPSPNSTASPTPRPYISARNRSPSILSVMNTPPLSRTSSMDSMGKSSVLIHEVRGDKSILPEGGISGRSSSAV